MYTFTRGYWLPSPRPLCIVSSLVNGSQKLLLSFWEGRQAPFTSAPVTSLGAAQALWHGLLNGTIVMGLLLWDYCYNLLILDIRIYSGKMVSTFWSTVSECIWTSTWAGIRDVLNGRIRHWNVGAARAWNWLCVKNMSNKTRQNMQNVTVPACPNCICHIFTARDTGRLKRTQSKPSPFRWLATWRVVKFFSKLSTRKINGNTMVKHGETLYIYHISYIL